MLFEFSIYKQYSSDSKNLFSKIESNDNYMTFNLSKLRGD